MAKVGADADADEARAGALAEQLNVLVEGAITTAAITGTPAPAHHARAAAEALLDRR